MLPTKFIKNFNKHNNQTSAPNLRCSRGRHDKKKTQQRLPRNRSTIASIEMGK